MLDKLKQMDRTRLILLIIIAASIPCYCFGMVLLRVSTGAERRATATAIGAVDGTPSAVVSATFTLPAGSATATLTPTRTPTFTPTITYEIPYTRTPTRTLTPSRTPTASPQPTATNTPVPPDTATPQTPTETFTASPEVSQEAPQTTP